MKRGSQFILFILLFLASVAALHQATIFHRHFRLKDLFTLPNTTFFTKIDDSQFTSPEDRLWLLGKTNWREDEDPKSQWDPVYQAFFDDPIIAARLVGRMPLPEDHLIRAAALDPENGWFDLLMAEQLAQEAFTRKKKPRPPFILQGIEKPLSDKGHRKRRPPITPYIESFDEDVLDQAIAALAKASEKPYIDSYSQQFLTRWATTTMPEYDLATAYQNFLIYLSSPGHSPHTQSVSRAFTHRMNTLADNGDKRQFLHLLKIVEKLFWSRFQSASNPIHTTRQKLKA